MTKEQIEKYEFCKSHLSVIKDWKDKLPHGIQKYGASSLSPAIEHELERIHRNMHETIREAYDDASAAIQAIIEEN